MSNPVIEFVLRIKNMMGNDLQQAARNSMPSLKMMNEQLDKLKDKRAISVDTREITRLNREIGQVEANMRRVQQMGLAPAVASGGGMSAWQVAKGTMLGGAIMGGVERGVGALTGFFQDSIQASMDAAMRAKSFEVLLGSEQRGKDFFAKLRHMKETTLVGGSVYQNAQTMLGFGVPEAEALKKLHQIGDIGMGDVQRMQTLTLAYSQQFANGKLQGNDMLQFIGAGFNPLKVIAERYKDFGFQHKVTMAQLNELKEKGAITANMVTKAFDIVTAKGGQFYEMMQSMNETPGGKLKLLEGKMFGLKIDVGNQLMPIAVSAMERASELLRWVQRNNMIERMKPYVDGIVAGFKSTTEWLANNTDSLKSLVNTTKELIKVYLAMKATKIAGETYNALRGGLGYGIGGATTGMALGAGAGGSMMGGLYGLGLYAAMKLYEEAHSQFFGEKSTPEWAGGKPYLDKSRSTSAGVRGAPGAPLTAPLSTIAIATKEKGWGKFTPGVFDPNDLNRSVAEIKAQSKTPDKAMQEINEAIVKGGQRNVTINLNRSIVEKQEFNVRSMQEAVSVSLGEFEQLFLRTIEGAVAAAY